MEGKINIFHKESEISKRKCGNGYFFMGMYLRLVLSLLIDGDWTDTACFFKIFRYQREFHWKRRSRFGMNV